MTEEKHLIRVLFFRDHEKPGVNAADGRRAGAWGWLWGATAGFGVCPWAATHHATWADGLLTMKARVT